MLDFTLVKKRCFRHRLFPWYSVWSRPNGDPYSFPGLFFQVQSVKTIKMQSSSTWCLSQEFKEKSWKSSVPEDRRTFIFGLQVRWSLTWQTVCFLWKQIKSTLLSFWWSHFCKVSFCLLKRGCEDFCPVARKSLLWLMGCCPAHTRWVLLKPRQWLLPLSTPTRCDWIYPSSMATSIFLPQSQVFMLQKWKHQRASNHEQSIGQCYKWVKRRRCRSACQFGSMSDHALL